MKPIVRQTFKHHIFDRSPLFGVSGSSRLQTCFRIGEALNTGCNAVRRNETVLLELYARISKSWRDCKSVPTQHFVFHDLYHDRLPHLHGTIGVSSFHQKWNLEGISFHSTPQKNEMARVIATMKRDAQTWRLDILGIEETNWDEVYHVAGIYEPNPRPDLN